MSRRIACILVVACTILMPVVPAAADTVYSNLGKGGTFDDTNGWLVGGQMQVIANQFTPDADYTFTSAVLPLGIRSGSLMTIQLYVEEDSGGVPGDILEMISVDVPFPFPGAQLVTAVSKVNPTLAAGTPYWLVAAGPGTDTVWDLNATNDLAAGGNFAFNQKNSPTGPWLIAPDGLPRGAFEIDGDPLAAPAPIRPTQRPPKAPLAASDSVPW